MTITSTTTSVAYTGNDVTVAFAVTFPFFGTGSTAELRVIERVIATGAETVKTNVTDYTVTGGQGSTGTVTAMSAPASTVQWIIERDTTKTQETDYTANDPFPAETHEAALDRVTAIAQETDADASRALRFPVTDSSSLSAEIPNSVDRANARLGFDSNGGPVAVTSDVSGVAATAFGTSFVQAANAGAGNAVLFVKGSDIASATTITIPTDGNYFDVTGTTTITGMTVDAGRFFALQFDGALTFTDGASLDLAGQNIATAAGYRGLFYATADDTVQMVGFVAEGQSPALLDEDDLSSDSAAHGATQQSIKAYVDAASGGAVVNRWFANTGAVATGTAAIPLDDTIPQSSEGDQYLTVTTDTLASASNRLRISVLLNISCSSGVQCAMALFNGAASAICAVGHNAAAANVSDQISLQHEYAPGATTAVTFTVRASQNSGTLTVNGSGGIRRFGGTNLSSIIVEEIEP